MFKTDSSAKYADLSIQFVFRKISGRSRYEVLTQKEFELFCLFLEHRETLVCREEILSKVWKESLRSESLVNHLDVTMSRLRKKIANISKKVRIITVRGSGFVLCDKDLTKM